MLFPFLIKGCFAVWEQIAQFPFFPPSQFQEQFFHKVSHSNLRILHFAPSLLNQESTCFYWKEPLFTFSVAYLNYQHHCSWALGPLLNETRVTWTWALRQQYQYLAVCLITQMWQSDKCIHALVMDTPSKKQVTPQGKQSHNGSISLPHSEWHTNKTCMYFRNFLFDMLGLQLAMRNWNKKRGGGQG